MGQLGVAVVGTGFMSWVHAEALRHVGGVQVIGIAGSSAEKARSAAARLGLERAYESFDHLLDDHDVQAVHVATPNRHHFEMARRTIASGRHVLCEKPLATSQAETQQLVRLAEQRPRLAAGVNYNMRFYPLCLETRERVRRGDLGELIHVSGSYAQDWLLQPTDYNWRVLAEEVGQLRAVADIGTHWFDLIQAITSRRIEAVCADLQTFHAKRYRPKGELETFQSPAGDQRQVEPIDVTTEDFGCVMARFAGGMRGSLCVSQVTAGRKNCLRFELAGSKQAVAWNSEVPNELWIGNRDRANELLMRDPSLLCPAASAAATYPGGHNEGFADSFRQCFRAFYEYIDGGDPSLPSPFPTFADGHREIVLCEAIVASHRDARWIEL